MSIEAKQSGTLGQRIKDIFTGNRSTIEQLKKTNVSLIKENAGLKEKHAKLVGELTEVEEAVNFCDAVPENES